MEIVQSFLFGETPIRVLGTHDSPLFILTDVCKALNLSQPSRVLARIDACDGFKVPVETAGGRQTVTVINESGLYTVVLRSDDAMKEDTVAYKFRRWVVSEVLPTIRKTGRYELPRDTLTTEEQYEVRKAVKLRAKNSAIHYQTIYNAMYEYFKIASYKDLTRAQLQNALAFIRTSDIKPQLPPVDIPEGALVLEKSDAKRIANFVYFWKYLFRSDLELIHELLQRLDSPKASHFHDAVNELNLSLLEGTLEKYGYSVTQMPCYKHHNSLTNAPRN